MDKMNPTARQMLDVLREHGTSMPFVELVERVVSGVHVDEATAKAAILRLSSDGQVEITADWDVRLATLSEGTPEAA
jgi:hypothetical protein